MELTGKLERIREQMAAACARAHRNEAGVRLLAATKTVPEERIRAAYGLGVRCFGENRVQERAAKHAALAGLTAEWRLIGPLQSNKAAKAVELFDAVDSVDSLALAQRLDRMAAAAGKRLRCLIEVNIGREPQKGGVRPEAAAELAAAMRRLPGLALEGVMAIPPAAERAEATRPYFAALARLAAELELREVSMGMTHDFEVAIEEGATLVRVGSGLFGERG